MLVDVVLWKNVAQGCSRCAGAAPRYSTPYWEPNKRVCHKCACELARLFDEHGWPLMLT